MLRSARPSTHVRMSDREVVEDPGCVAVHAHLDVTPIDQGCLHVFVDDVRALLARSDELSAQLRAELATLRLNAREEEQ